MYIISCRDVRHKRANRNAKESKRSSTRTRHDFLQPCTFTLLLRRLNGNIIARSETMCHQAPHLNLGWLCFTSIHIYYIRIHKTFRIHYIKKPHKNTHSPIKYLSKVMDLLPFTFNNGCGSTSPFRIVSSTREWDRAVLGFARRVVSIAKQRFRGVVCVCVCSLRLRIIYYII